MLSAACRAGGAPWKMVRRSIALTQSAAACLHSPSAAARREARRCRCCTCQLRVFVLSNLAVVFCTPSNRTTFFAAHVAVTETKGDTEVGIFGVFDGHGARLWRVACVSDTAACPMMRPVSVMIHYVELASRQPHTAAGGAEVAKFCQRHFAQELKSCGQYQDDQVGEGLIQVSFHNLQLGVRQPPCRSQLCNFAQSRHGVRAAVRGTRPSTGFDPLRPTCRCFTEWTKCCEKRSSARSWRP